MLGMLSGRKQDPNGLSFVEMQALPVGCVNWIWEQKGYSGNILILVIDEKILQFVGRTVWVSE